MTDERTHDAASQDAIRFGSGPSTDSGGAGTPDVTGRATGGQVDVKDRGGMAGDRLAPASGSQGGADQDRMLGDEGSLGTDAGARPDETSLDAAFGSEAVEGMDAESTLGTTPSRGRAHDGGGGASGSGLGPGATPGGREHSGTQGNVGRTS